MKATNLIVVAIGVVIGLALSPIIASNVTTLTRAPDCSVGDPQRIPSNAAVTAPAGTSGLYNGFTGTNNAWRGVVVCSATSPLPSTINLTPGSLAPADIAVPQNSGGTLSALYAGRGASPTTQSNGALTAAGSVVDLIPILYIAGILIVPIGMLGFRYMRR